MASCEIRGEFKPGFETVLTPHALGFVARLTERFGPKISELLALRGARQKQVNGGELPDHQASTLQIRELDWIVAEIPEDLQDRRLEGVVPALTRHLLVALNCDVNVCIADMEDTLSPTWDNVVNAHCALYEACRGTLKGIASDGVERAMGANTPTLALRPRGLHSIEKHLYVNGQPVPAALVDVGLHLFHNADALVARGSGPYISLPKLESQHEARLWTSVLEFAETDLGLRQYGIRASAYIETLPAIFEIDEILYVLKDYLVGLECGPLDYLFSFVKTLHAHPEYVLPDQSHFDMEASFVHAYLSAAIQTAHQRGVLVVGGSAAHAPFALDDPDYASYLSSMRERKRGEIDMGFDGTWVTQGGLVPEIKAVYEQHMHGKNQLGRLLRDLRVTSKDLLDVPVGQITMEGVRNNVRLAVRYLAAWLTGRGWIVINNRRNEMASAEFARACLWQWVHHRTGVLEDGTNIDMPMVSALLQESVAVVREDLAAIDVDDGQVKLAVQLLSEVTASDEFVSFLSDVAYEYLP